MTCSVVTPVCSCTRRISARVETRSCASRFESGSSSSSTRGRAASARPSATRWRSPPESSPGRRSSRPSSAERLRGLAHARRDRRLRLAARPQPERDVALDRQVREQREALEDHRDAAPRRRDARLVVAVDQHAPGVRRLEPGDRAQQRRLAGAGGAEHGDELTRRDGEGDLAQRLDAAVAARDSLDVERRLKTGRRSPSPGASAPRRARSGRSRAPRGCRRSCPRPRSSWPSSGSWCIWLSASTNTFELAGGSSESRKTGDSATAAATARCGPRRRAPPGPRAERVLDPLPRRVGLVALGEAEAVGVQHAGRLDVGRERRDVPLEVRDRAQQRARRGARTGTSPRLPSRKRSSTPLASASSAVGAQPFACSAITCSRPRRPSGRVEQELRRVRLVVDELAAGGPHPRRGADRAEVDADAVVARRRSACRRRR